MIRIRNPQNCIGKYLGPCSNPSFCELKLLEIEIFEKLQLRGLVESFLLRRRALDTWVAQASRV